MRFQEYRVVFLIVIVVLALLAASPAFSRLLVLPKTESFSEMWILGPNHMAEDYPFNITDGHDYDIFLGLVNRLGYAAYYRVELKFRNQTQSAPNSFNRTHSSLRPLLGINSFVPDEGSWELPVRFSFYYDHNEDKSEIFFHSLAFNDVVLDLQGYSAVWNSTRQTFSGNLFFELWIFNNETNEFYYHERFVNLQLNMTLT